MKLEYGQIISFKDYLATTARPCSTPIIWKNTDIKSALTSLPHEQRGTLALSNPGISEPAAIAPGISFAIQVIKHGEETKPHAHSFWHIYIVQSGTGRAILGNQADINCIEPGDVLFVPAWCLHKFSHHGQPDQLVLFVLQNLPQNAALGNLVREESSSHKVVVYLDVNQEKQV